MCGLDCLIPDRDCLVWRQVRATAVILLASTVLYMELTVFYLALTVLYMASTVLYLAVTVLYGGRCARLPCSS